MVPDIEMKRPVHIFAALGFTSMVGQIVLMRELVVVFYGSELSLGIMLGAWLFWVGIGSLLGAALVPRIKALGGLPVLAALQVLLGLATAGTLLMTRALPLMIRGGSGVGIIGYAPIIVSSFIMLAPMCLLLGFLFDLFCHVWSDDGEDDAGTGAGIGAVYVFEGLGAALGGLVFAGILVWVLDPVQIACALLGLNLAAASATLALRAPLRLAAALMLVATLALMIAGFAYGAPRLREASLGWLWGELQVTHSQDSIYGNIAVVEKEEEKALYENGLLMFSNPDDFSAEESVHFALIEHPDPQRVLLIGGGVGGSLIEALKHPVERIEYLELDPLVIEIARNHFPAEIGRALEDPRVSVRNMDGRLFLKQAAGENAERFDVIIVNLPDPYTALINRFYTLEFFRECRAKMSPGGILSFRVSSAENYISPELRQFLGCLKNTLDLVFEDVKVVPGESNIFLACTTGGVLTLDSDELIRRLSQRGIREKLRFIREYYLPHRLAPERIKMLEEALAGTDARINTDLAPVCYYYHAVLWSKQFGGVSGAILARFAQVRPQWILAAILLLTLAGLSVQRLFPKAWGPKSILVAVATTGFAEISIEIVALLGFQAIHGYVYYKMAIIMTAFMVGLTAGAAAMGLLIRRGAAGMRSLIAIQVVVCAYPLLLLGALILFTRAGPEDAGGIALRAQIAFPLLALVAGLVGGLQFPLAGKLWLEETPGAARAAGYVYGADLLGACAGALLTTALLVPVLGIPWACMTASALNLGGLLMLMLRPGTD
jgi:spermidine synthase